MSAFYCFVLRNDALNLCSEMLPPVATPKWWPSAFEILPLSPTYSVSVLLNFMTTMDQMRNRRDLKLHLLITNPALLLKRILCS